MDFIKKNLSIIALVIVATGAAFYYLAPGEEEIVTSSDPASSSEATFLGFASELETVTFNPEIFSDPRFVSLKNIRTGIVSELSGRRDPFAPLSGVTTAP